MQLNFTLENKWGKRGMADKDFKTDIKLKQKSNPVCDLQIIALKFFFCGLSAGSWVLLPNPCEQKWELIHWITQRKCIPHIKRKTNKQSPHRGTINMYTAWIFEGFPEEEESWFFFPWIFHWKHRSSLYRNDRKSIKGPKEERDISSLPALISYFL